MAISEDVQHLLEGVHHYLAVVLPQLPISEPAEQQRVRLLDQLREVALRYPAVNFAGHKARDFDSTESIDQNKAASPGSDKCEPSSLPGLALVAGAKRVMKRSGSVSSRSSSGSYTSTSYTSNGYTSTSYTSNGYGSYEGGCGQHSANGAVQEDIYEEFDAVQLRIPEDESAGACPSSSTTNSSSSSSSSSFSHSSPFFSSLRSSLTYGKKDKLYVSAKSKKSDDEKSKKSERQSKGKSMEDISSGLMIKNKKNAKYSVLEAGNKTSLLGQKPDSAENVRHISLGVQEAVSGHLENGSEAKSEWDVQSEKRHKFSAEERRSSGVESLCGQEEEAENSYMEGLQPVPFSSNIACCSHHGVLQKKTKRLLRQCRPYHAVVASGILFLYNKETDHRQHKSLELCWYDVRVATGEEVAHLSQPSRDSSLFELVAPGRKTHTFMARSVWDRDTWIQAVGQHTKNKASLPLSTSRHSTLASAAADTETAPGQHSDVASGSHEADFGNSKCDVGEHSVGSHEKIVDSHRRSSDVNKKNSDANLKNGGANVPLLSRGSSTTSLGTNPLFSFTIKSPCKSGPPFAGPVPSGRDATDDVCSFPASCDDTFSSEEMYEEVNMEDIRCSSGPSLSEMLEPHLFPSGHLSGAYYCVPNENITEDSTDTSTEGKLPSTSCHMTPIKETKHPISSPITPNRDAKQAPARPPPPNFSTEKLVKNNSALHHIISPKNSLTAFPGLTKPGDSSVNSTSHAPPLVRRCLPFSASPRPLPETPQEVHEEGEIYDEIDEDDFYEENEADGTSLQKTSQVSGSTPAKKNYSVLNPPPPLPLRGPPPIPSLPPPTTFSKNEMLATDLSLFEDYDVPDDVNKINVVAKSTDDGDDLFASPKRPDLSIDLPPFSLSNCGASSETTAVSSQIDTRIDSLSDNVYKVPNPTHPVSDNHPVSEDVYKIPASIPIPVGNNNENFPYKSKREIHASPSNAVETKGSAARSTAINTTNNSKVEVAVKPSVVPPCELYQSPPPKSIPVSPLPSNAIIGSYSRSKVNSPGDLKAPNQSENSAPNFGQPRKLEKLKDGCGKISSSTSLNGNSLSKKQESSVSVKERIALLNQSKICDAVATPPRAGPKSPDELVVLLDSKEVRLDQAKKKAFLESTLNFTSVSKTKPDASPLSLSSNR